MESENDVEEYLVKKVKERGGHAYKFTSPGRTNVPDRLCVLPGLVVFVEVKAPGKKPSAKQHRELKRLAKLKMNVFVVDRIAAVDDLMRRLESYVDDEKSTPVSKASNN